MRVSTASLQRYRSAYEFHSDSSFGTSSAKLICICSRARTVWDGLLRAGLVVVLLWIGGLRFASYEADGIVPLVSNSPVASFLYHHPAPEYRQHMNKEGEVKPANQEWQRSNNSYLVSYGLGVVIVTLGLLIGAAASIGNRKWVACPDVPYDAFLFGDDTRSLGPGFRRRASRLSLFVRSRQAHYQGFDHARCRCLDHG